MSRKKKILYSFIALIVGIIIYNISFSKEITTYFNQNQSNTNERKYVIDLYADTAEEKISGYQLKLNYPENIELDSVEDGDIGNVSMNKYAKKIIGYGNTAFSGKVKLCTLTFNIIERGADDTYQVDIDFSNNYTKFIDENGKKIDLNENSNSNTKNNNNNSNEESSNNGSKNSNVTKEESSNDSDKVVYGTNERVVSNNKTADRLPNTGVTTIIVIIDVALIALAAVFGYKNIKSKRKDS